jgi:uncharacterized membrane protein SpoIIM required for sporulation
MDIASEEEKKPYNLRRNQIELLRRRLASLFELSVYMFVCVFIAVRAILLQESDGRHPDPVTILTNSSFLISASVLALAIFFNLLTGLSPLVNLAVNGKLVSALSSPSDFLSTLAGTLLKVSESSKEPLRIVDDAEVAFAAYVARSQDAARTAQRRPNALLFIGTLVAVAGLIFFVLTLPGSRYGILLPTDSGTTSQDFWSAGLQLLPRLLMLIFIQVLAGFFLRQYRSSMEDFRYYESILRHREAQLLSYILRKKIGDSESILAFAEEIMKEQSIGVLSQGQTTAALEAQRLAANDISSFYEKLAELVASATNGKPSRKTPAAHKKPQE